MKKFAFAAAVLLAATAFAADPMFAQMDRDRNGRLSAAEHVQGSRAMFARMDRDRSGLLSEAEFTAGHAVLLSRR